MEPAKRRNLALTILGLGLLALGVDHFLLRPGAVGPASAQAASVMEPSASAPQPTHAPAPSAPITLAQRLREVAGELEARRNPTSSGPLPNAFDAPAAWRTVQTPEATPAADPIPEAEVQFPDLKLSSLTSTLAVICGKTVVAGAAPVEVSMGDRKVKVAVISIDVKARQAVVEIDARRVVLVLPEPA